MGKARLLAHLRFPYRPAVSSLSLVDLWPLQSIKHRLSLFFSQPSHLPGLSTTLASPCGVPWMPVVGPRTHISPPTPGRRAACSNARVEWIDATWGLWGEAPTCTPNQTTHTTRSQGRRSCWVCARGGQHSAHLLPLPNHLLLLLIALIWQQQQQQTFIRPPPPPHLRYPPTHPPQPPTQMARLGSSSSLPLLLLLGGAGAGGWWDAAGPSSSCVVQVCDSRAQVYPPHPTTHPPTSLPTQAFINPFAGSRGAPAQRIRQQQQQQQQQARFSTLTPEANTASSLSGGDDASGGNFVDAPWPDQIDYDDLEDKGSMALKKAALPCTYRPPLLLPLSTPPPPSPLSINTVCSIQPTHPPTHLLLNQINTVWQQDVMRLEFPVEKSQRDFWTHYEVGRWVGGWVGG